MYPFREFTVSEAARHPHYLVVGHPISHSLSPLMHRAALQHHHIEADYHAVDLEYKDLTAFISWMNKDSFLGANITIPYKQEMIRVADWLDSTVESIGALNTIVKKNGILSGYNTDVTGFRSPLESYENLLAGEQAIIFGTGGASRAVRYALRELGLSRVIMVSRNPGQHHPEEASDEHLVFSSYQNWHAFAEESILLVNTTPLGMSPDLQSSPIKEEEVHLLGDRICYDLVYNPVKTTFIKQAEKAGADYITGLEMFLQQGNESFRLWTGKSFPVKKIKKLIISALQEE
ncbi:MAG: shikimate dehydrogenase [Balneolaceae bacterium]